MAGCIFISLCVIQYNRTLLTIATHQNVLFCSIFCRFFLCCRKKNWDFHADDNNWWCYALKRCDGERIFFVPCMVELNFRVKDFASFSVVLCWNWVQRSVRNFLLLLKMKCWLMWKFSSYLLQCNIVEYFEIKINYKIFLKEFLFELCTLNYWRRKFINKTELNFRNIFIINDPLNILRRNNLSCLMSPRKFLSK